MNSFAKPFSCIHCKTGGDKDVFKKAADLPRQPDKSIIPKPLINNISVQTIDPKYFFYEISFLVQTGKNHDPGDRL